MLCLDQGHSSVSIDLAVANAIKQASVLAKSKQSADSGRSFSTLIVAESNKSGGEASEIAGKPFWKSFGFFGKARTDFGLEKVNFPENALFYLNQSYLIIQKSKKNHYVDYFLLVEIHESADLPEDIKNSECKEDEVK